MVPTMVSDNASGRAPIQISVHGLTAGFAGKSATLRDISFDIAPGEIVGLVGESGSGKSFLARTIMGKVPRGGLLQSGTIRYRAADGGAPPVLGQEMAMIVANPQAEINPVEPVGRQIANLIRFHRKVSKREADLQAIAMLKAVSIPDPESRYHSYAHQLSGGMAQRIVIAMGLCCDPSFVIADDATSGLDVTVQTQVLNLLRNMVRERNASALIITRDISIVAHYCDRIAVLHQGEIVETGSVSRFFDKPSHPYSNRLLAAFAYSKAAQQRWTLRATEADRVRLEDAACRYMSRCPLAQDRCRQVAPLLAGEHPDHAVRCHFPVDAQHD